MDCFTILQKDSGSSARLGLLTTAHGEVETPVFMPVGTCGAVKGITPSQLKDVGARIILTNTYHLLLRPGVDCVEQVGGLHKFMGWDGPIVTDSGGYQVFSLGLSFNGDSIRRGSRSPLCKVDDEKVEFISHIDGSRIYLDAETATQIQNRLGSDIIMCLDQCPAFECEKEELKDAVTRTIRWAKRCRQAHSNQSQLQFGIVQGGIDPQLRQWCSTELVKLDFDGYAIGGLSVGEGHENMVKTVAHTSRFLPESKPRYLMGVGMPYDIIAAVAAGVDMFDCVLPTRNGRNAFAFTEEGPLRLRNSIHSTSIEPVERLCDCYCCRNFTRAAIRHFFNVGEMLGPILLSLHNLRFFQRLMAQIRSAIREGSFSDWAAKHIQKYRRQTTDKGQNN